MRRRRPRAE